MNAVEIEEAVSALVDQPLDPTEFPYAFLLAFGNKDTTVKRLRNGDTNKSDLGGVLQRNNIHLAVAPAGEVSATLAKLRESPATAKHKARFILATDGETVEAEELGSGEPLACGWRELPDHLGFFLPLAGITAVREIRENAFDIRATSKLNKLYVALLKENPAWGSDERRPDMNHFMARLIFSFFAEDTGIFPESRLFTDTVSRMSAPDSSNTHEVIGALFRAMNTKHEERESAGLPRWAMKFPYVNGGLFSGAVDVPRFSRTARSYLLQVGSLDWKQINPDIFGSMIQAVADDEERGALGMHYTSVPNILKVLNPLFFDDLRAKLEVAGDNPRALLNLRKRIARIRVFDPACGSGNFLVIAYKEMRAIEHEINRRRGEAGRQSEIPLTNFRGIELRDFAAEIARLALIIAEFQCDELYRGQKDAIQDFLPLDAENWITCGNALRLDWFSICPPKGTQVKLVGDDLFSTPLDQPEIDFENAGGETYICGNPPYKGSQDQTEQQKADLVDVFAMAKINHAGSADYVLGWFALAAAFVRKHSAKFAFVTTNSIHQGRQVARIWPALLGPDLRIVFAEPSFKWSNLAAKKATVTVSVIGVSSVLEKCRVISDGLATYVDHIGPYMVPGPTVFVNERRTPLSDVSPMSFGSMPNDGGALLLDYSEYVELALDRRTSPFIRTAAGTREFVNGVPRYCIWVDDARQSEARAVSALSSRFDRVRTAREQSRRPATKSLSQFPYRFGEVRQTGDESVIIVSKTASENRDFVPAALLERGGIVTEAFGIFDAPAWNLAVLVSRLHSVWIKTVCGRMKSESPRLPRRLPTVRGWSHGEVDTAAFQS
jgi:hypothetical protein